MRARLRVCAEPGCGRVQAGARCPDHQAQRNRWLSSTTPTKRSQDRDRHRRAAVVARHRRRFGDWCPGFEVPAHASSDLTADHVHELQAGGRWDGRLQVLCRACNSRKGTRTTAAMRREVERSCEGVGGGPAAARRGLARGRALDGAEGSRRPVRGRPKADDERSG
ncbi:HNH endonuclease [Gordonia sp. (in: high G+C Gram-positive bacteria)]|uniref:HNH endonuclease n=1 Tax=Gordonia sp. (in: high G+C Gram-positive bacteria) TaxID=84139 RepID=UPI0025C3F1C2|nr:HNH endonuclease [Gordonia sp. (in: high G+C Gram-positive bacteria)]HMS75626.1 HNH endonuclease [Gordonia sp. (in: high G+C Gram-positive bacteria)]